MNMTEKERERLIKRLNRATSALGKWGGMRRG
jgi:hypothetical protein